MTPKQIQTCSIPAKNHPKQYLITHRTDTEKEEEPTTTPKHTKKKYKNKIQEHTQKQDVTTKTTPMEDLQHKKTATQRKPSERQTI